MNPKDEDARRAYWAEQMELGHELVERTVAFSVQECGERFASLRQAADDAGVEMLFSTSRIAGQLDRVFFIREGLAARVVAVGREMNARGWVLKIEDGYRSLEMQRELVRKPAVFDAILQKCIWENNDRLPRVELVARRALVLVANLPKPGTHMSGSAIDISVFRRDDGSEVWRGFPYLEMSEHTPMRSPFVEKTPRQQRLEISKMMEAHGWVPFPFEFWHFNQGDALGHVVAGQPGPARYGPVDWDPSTNRVTPCTNPLEPLIPLPMMEREITASLERASQRPS